MQIRKYLQDYIRHFDNTQIIGLNFSYIPMIQKKEIFNNNLSLLIWIYRIGHWPFIEMNLTFRYIPTL